MGDALLCCGLVRTLCKRGYELQIPAYPHNAGSVRLLFADLLKMGHAHVFEVSDENYTTPIGCDEIALGYRGENFDPTRFDWSFYRQAGVPFTDKWCEFRIGEIGESREGDIEPVKFIHDDKERGFVIPMDGYRPKRDGSIFYQLDALESCAEFHGINSSFAILADLLGIEGKLYLHRYARPDGGSLPIFGGQWRILDKP
jgi:hypothetical protein